MDPFTAMMIGSMVFNQLGIMQQGQAAAAAARFNAAINRKNAKLALAKGADDERRFRVMARKVIGTARASYSASGVTTAGSPQDVLEESAAVAEMDALTIRHNAEIKAQGFKDAARLNEMQAEAAEDSGIIGTVKSWFD